MLPGEVKTEWRDVPITMDTDTEKWKFSFGGHDFISDSLKEARASITKFVNAEKKDITPYKAFYIKNPRMENTKAIPVILTRFSVNRRVYLTSEQKGGNIGAVPMFIAINRYSDEGVYPRDNEVHKALDRFHAALAAEHLAQVNRNSAHEALLKMQFSEDKIKVMLSSKLKMEELNK